MNTNETSSVFMVISVTDIIVIFSCLISYLICLINFKKPNPFEWEDKQFNNFIIISLVLIVILFLIMDLKLKI